MILDRSWEIRKTPNFISRLNRGRSIRSARPALPWKGGRALIVGRTFWPKGLSLGFRREADSPWLWPWARLGQSCHRSFAAAAASWKSPRLGREWPMAFPDRSVVPPPSTVRSRYEAKFLKNLFNDIGTRMGRLGEVMLGVRANYR